ncbi:hypothetical protein VSH64_01565 [Amycolatopsis rhabdoformis]|uniref:Uncharacterized protein n=1 Tax=Amycolatopsis rhabdoformis TaxID=1448059 RepID=A0ABZ1IA77_9PSEU|nr:hypothetical protein [Amycolatopsis rhabdoformis]WSE30827.1 hypothetical protein VSH64_01565 [Amycolatopsis rhabdoformis]
MFTVDGAVPAHQPGPAEKLAAFGVPVVVAEEVPGSADTWVGLDRIDGRPVVLDVIDHDHDHGRLLQVRNVREQATRITFGDLARTTLSEFLLANDHFARAGDESRGAQQPRSQEFLARLRVVEPQPMPVVLDGAEVTAAAVVEDGFAAAELAVATGQVFVIGAVEAVRGCRLRTLPA